MIDVSSPGIAYSKDLTDAEWERIAPLLPEEKRFGRHRVTNLREVVSAINYRDQIGCPWRMLPDDFPPWGTVYSYYRRWNRDGTLPKLRTILKRRPPRVPARCDAQPPSANHGAIG